MPREPWIKVKIGIRRSGKIAGLPSDSARLGWFYVLVEAKVQRQMGVFDNRAHFVEVLGRFGKFVDAYRDAGLLEVVPGLCPECKRRHRGLRQGAIVVHDYLREQRDPTNADRQAAYREAHADEPESDDAVTATVTDTITRSVTGETGATVTADSRARATTATGTTTERDESGSPDVDRPALNGREPTLSKRELQAWSTFGPEWDGVKHAWLARGLRLPPAGDPSEGEGSSQRDILWQVLDHRPNDLVRWIGEAPGKTSHDIIRHVLERWHEIRTEAGYDDELAAWTQPTKGEAAETLGEILGRMR